MGCADVDFPAILSNAEHRLPSVYKCSQAIKVNQSNRHAAWDTCHNHQCAFCTVPQPHAQRTVLHHSVCVCVCYAVCLLLVSETSPLLLMSLF